MKVIIMLKKSQLKVYILALFNLVMLQKVIDNRELSHRQLKLDGRQTQWENLEIRN